MEKSTDLEDLEWEDNPNQIPFFYHMIAGSAAGLTEHVFMFPIDTLKTHVQCEKCGSVQPLQTWKCATGIVGREGIFRLWRGVSAMFIGCIPAHAAYFSVFEGAKKLFGADQEGHQPIAAAACGAVAAITHDSVMTPFDTVKQRMQLGYYNSVSHCIKTIMQSEGGIRVLYKSFPTTLAMNIPYGCVMVAVNESMKKFVTSVMRPESTRDSILALLISGSVAGGVASIMTTPMDVIKTRLQVQNLQPCPRFGNSNSSLPNIEISSQKRLMSTSVSVNTNSRGPIQIIQEILKTEGVRGFFRGAVPRMLVHMPSVAVSWTTYETIKTLLCDM